MTGGIGSGKSEAAKVFEELGAFIVDTDALAREAVAPNSDGLMEVVRVWPEVVRGSMLDRAALAEIVFNDPTARARLNAILHPHIRRLAIERETLARSGQLIVHVVPLLFETGYDRLVDKTIVVVAPENERIARVMARDGLDEARVRARISAQVSPEQASEQADFVLNNDGDLAHLKEQAGHIYDALSGELHEVP